MSGEGKAGGVPAPELGSLAEKIEYLFQHVYPGKVRPYTLQEVVDKARGTGGPTISLGFLHALRAGKSANPTLQHLQALAAVFDVPVDFFIKDDVAATLAPQLKLLTLLHARGVTAIALRAADLAPAARDTLLAVIEALERQATGDAGRSARGARGGGDEGADEGGDDVA